MADAPTTSLKNVEGGRKHQLLFLAQNKISLEISL